MSLDYGLGKLVILITLVFCVISSCSKPAPPFLINKSIEFYRLKSLEHLDGNSHLSPYFNVSLANSEQSFLVVVSEWEMDWSALDKNINKENPQDGDKQNQVVEKVELLYSQMRLSAGKSISRDPTKVLLPIGAAGRDLRTSLILEGAKTDADLSNTESSKKSSSELNALLNLTTKKTKDKGGSITIRPIDDEEIELKRSSRKTFKIAAVFLVNDNDSTFTYRFYDHIFTQKIIHKQPPHPADLLKADISKIEIVDVLKTKTRLNNNEYVDSVISNPHGKILVIYSEFSSLLPNNLSNYSNYRMNLGYNISLHTHDGNVLFLYGLETPNSTTFQNNSYIGLLAPDPEKPQKKSPFGPQYYKLIFLIDKNFKAAELLFHDKEIALINLDFLEGDKE